MTSTSPRKITDFRDIPSKRILINDASQLPIDYSSTPGGTIFSTTPGGTRIIYDRQFLMQMRNSPVARTPPKNLPRIPGVTSPASENLQVKNQNIEPIDEKSTKTDAVADEPLFEMDI